MFDEIHVMASKGLVMVLFSLLILHPCFLVFLPILTDHSILGSVLGIGLKKMA